MQRSTEGKLYALVLPATNLRFTTQKLKIDKTFIGNQGVAINSLIVNIQFYADLG